MYEETFIDLEGIFAEIEPEELYQQILYIKIANI